jgi:hypothetical protein
MEEETGAILQYRYQSVENGRANTRNQQTFGNTV